jgi:hypothetical protein
VIEACCPHFFPHTPGNCKIVGETMASCAADQYEKLQDFGRLAKRFSETTKQ